MQYLVCVITFVLAAGSLRADTYTASARTTLLVLDGWVVLEECSQSGPAWWRVLLALVIVGG
jgi:hypothetical protein